MRGCVLISSALALFGPESGQYFFCQPLVQCIEQGTVVTTELALRGTLWRYRPGLQREERNSATYILGIHEHVFDVAVVSSLLEQLKILVQVADFVSAACNLI